MFFVSSLKFRAQATSIQKIMIVAVDAYKHVKITCDHKVIETIKQKLCLAMFVMRVLSVY